MGFFTSSFRKRHFKYVKHTREFSSRSPTHEVGFAFTRTDLSKWRCSAIVYWCTWISANRPQALWASWYHHKLMLLPVLVSSCILGILERISWMKFTLEVPFHYLPITCVSYLPGLTLICHCKHFQRSRGNCSCSFSICCLLRLRRVTKKNLLQVQKSYSISLSEHFQIHSSASLGDLMIFAREMIWQNSKIYVSVLLLNSRFSQSKITCLFFFFSWKDCQDGAVP